MIYLDNAATTLQKPQEVVRAVAEAMTTLGNAGRGTAGPSLAAARTLFAAREKIAAFFHAGKAENVAFTSNATESLNTAIRGLVRPGDHVISTVMEHNSVLRPLYLCCESGAEVTFAGCSETGELLYEEVERARKENTRFLICTHGSNLTGCMNDLERLGAFARKYGLIFIVDVSQTAGLWPVDMEACGIDVVCFTGHKELYGPQGTGGLCVREGLRIRPLKSGGSGVDSYNRHHPSFMPEALEAGTQNGPGIAGLLAAVTFLEKRGIDMLREKTLGLSMRFARKVQEIPGVQVYGNMQVAMRCPIVSLNIRDISSAEISDALWVKYGIVTRAGAHCAPRMHEALGTVRQGAVRFSFSCQNTEEEADLAAQAVKELAESL